MEKKITKLTENVPNGHKNVPTSSVARSSKIHPNWDFWFENKPSGNPVRLAFFQKRLFCQFANLVKRFNSVSDVHRKRGVDTMIEIFCEFRQSPTKNGVFLENHCYVTFLQRLAVV
jgi:hypothetical protein